MRCLIPLLGLTCLLLLPSAEGAAMRRSPENVLRRSRRLVRMLESGQAREDPATWREEAAETLRLLLWTTTVPGGQMAASLEPEGDRLVRKMRSWAGGELPLPEVETMREWVQSLEEIYRRGRRLSSPSPDQETLTHARRVLQLELSRPIYSEARRPGAGLSERLANLVARYVMDPLFGKRAQPARQVLLLACFTLLALLLAHVIWELARAGRGTAPRPADSTGISREEMLGTPDTARQLLDRGDDARQNGNLLRAMGFYYLALITSLARAGCTRLDRSLTNWEHYRHSAGSEQLPPEQLERLAEATDFFDRRFYGPHKTSQNDARHLRQQVVEITDALP